MHYCSNQLRRFLVDFYGYIIVPCQNKSLYYSECRKTLTLGHFLSETKLVKGSSSFSFSNYIKQLNPFDEQLTRNTHRVLC